MVHYPSIDVVCVFASELLEVLKIEDTSELAAFLRDLKRVQRAATKQRVAALAEAQAAANV